MSAWPANQKQQQIPAGRADDGNYFPAGRHSSGTAGDPSTQAPTLAETHVTPAPRARTSSTGVAVKMARRLAAVHASAPGPPAPPYSALQVCRARGGAKPGRPQPTSLRPGCRLAQRRLLRQTGCHLNHSRDLLVVGTTHRNSPSTRCWPHDTTCSSLLSPDVLATATGWNRLGGRVKR